MKFMLTFAWKPNTTTQTRNEGIARFMKGAGTPPQGAMLLGRWTRADFGGGFDLLECDDPKALVEFALRWSDLMDLSLFPVVDDEPLGEVLQRVT